VLKIIQSYGLGSSFKASSEQMKCWCLLQRLNAQGNSGTNQRPRRDLAGPKKFLVKKWENIFNCLVKERTCLIVWSKREHV
jgi:hypothetical protein